MSECFQTLSPKLLEKTVAEFVAKHEELTRANEEKLSAKEHQLQQATAAATSAREELDRETQRFSAKLAALNDD